MIKRYRFFCCSRRKRKREPNENADVLRALNSGKFQSMLLKGDAAGAIAFADGLDDDEFDSSKSYLPSDTKFVSCAFSALLIKDSDARERLLDHIDRSGGLCDNALLQCNAWGVTALGTAARRGKDGDDRSFKRFSAPRFEHLWQVVTLERPQNKAVMTPLISVFYNYPSCPILGESIPDDATAAVARLTIRPETLNAVDDRGYTALTHAITTGRAKTLRALLLRLPELVLEPDQLGAFVSIDLAFQKRTETSPTRDEMRVAIASARVYMEHYNTTVAAIVTDVLECLLPPLRALILEFALIRCRLAPSVCPKSKLP